MVTWTRRSRPACALPSRATSPILSSLPPMPRHAGPQTRHLAKALTVSRRAPAQDVYGLGKQAARLARIALIADQLNASSARATAASALVLALDPWFSGTNPAPWPNAPVGSGALVYDETYGGLVSRVSLHDPGADYGNGKYNDHHFHYGYLLYSAAVACRLDTTFCDRHRSALLDVFDDIAALPPRDDAGLPRRFPTARCKDLYDGHSWASGLFAMANGKSQESSSEAVNAYYGAALAAESLGDEERASWARVLLSMEVRAAQWYWHVPSSSTVYDPALVRNNRMVGVVSSTDANVGTWFGAQVEYVHGINIMPVTPVTARLFPVHFAEEVVQQLRERGLGAMDMNWRAFAVAVHAIVDPSAAIAELNAITAFDNGNSRTNMLHWIATRQPVPKSRAP